MLIENQFDVEASPDEVYALMLDVERVATCLPGTQVLGRRDDGSFDGQMSLKLGPMKMQYKGTVAIAEKDDAARTAKMLAKGLEAKGQGSAEAVMSMAVAQLEGGGSSVSVSTDMKVTGRVAQMGHGIMKDVSTKMIGTMAQNMENLLAAEGGAAPPSSPDVAAPSGGASTAGSAATVTGENGSATRGDAAASGATSEPPAAGATTSGERPTPPLAPQADSHVSVLTVIGAVIKGRWAALRAYLRRRR